MPERVSIAPIAPKTGAHLAVKTGGDELLALLANFGAIVPSSTLEHIQHKNTAFRYISHNLRISPIGCIPGMR